jgi:hypothetical protein
MRIGGVCEWRIHLLVMEDERLERHSGYAGRR